MPDSKTLRIYSQMAELRRELKAYQEECTHPKGDFTIDTDQTYRDPHNSTRRLACHCDICNLNWYIETDDPNHDIFKARFDKKD